MEQTIAAALRRPLRLDPPELLRERPNRGALIAYRGREADGKLRINELDRRTPALHQRLAAVGFCAEVGIPRMLGILPEAQIWLQERVEGRLLRDLLALGGEIAPFEATGRALAQLHRIPTAALGCRSCPLGRSTTRSLCLPTRWTAPRVRPDLTAALRNLSSDLGARARALAPRWVTSIHRDFYPDQVIVGPARTWLLDLDLFSLGGAKIDIANFVAHLREFGLRRWREAKALAGQEEAFLAGYAAIAPLPEPMQLDLLTTISLARHVWISSRIPERRHVTEAIARACRSIAVARWPAQALNGDLCDGS